MFFIKKYFLFAIKNICKRPYRSLCLILAAFIGSYAVFVGATLKLSLNNGIRRMQERFGADLMIVPEESEIKAKGILLTGEPEFFYMDSSVEETVKNIAGIETVTSQFYFTSLSADCCSTRVQLIAFDPDSDFVISPWVDERIFSNLEEGRVIIGYNVNALSNGNVKFYGSEYEVAGKLGETATGLDSSVFMTRDTMHLILDAALEKGYQFLNPEEDEAYVSIVLVKAEKDADLNQVQKEIYKNVSGIKVLETDKLISEVSVQLESINGVINGTLGVLLILSFITMLLFFSVIFHERKKEFAIMRIMGATSKKVAHLALSEGIIIGITGGFTGFIFGILTVYPFNKLIENSLSVPYLMPPLLLVLLLGLAGVVAVTAFGALTSYISTRSLSKAETYFTMREGE